jgi:hypothetical protein
MNPIRRGLAALAGTVDEDHRRVGERFRQACLGETGVLDGAGMRLLGRGWFG